MKNITIIGLRILAIYAFLEALANAQYLLSYFLDQNEFIFSTGFGILTTFIVYLVFCFILYFKAPFIAEKVTTGFNDHSLEKIDYEKLAAVLFAAAGILICFWSLHSFIMNIGNLYHIRVTNQQNPGFFSRDVRTLLFGGGFQVVFGLLLFIGGKKIARWWYKFRDWT